MKLNSNKKGFTLIELLVVIAIIGLLATLAVVSLSSARTKARDAKRKSDATAFMKAVELYFADFGVYPPSGGATTPNAAWSNASDASWNTLQTAVKPYLPVLPKDPQQSANPAIWGATGYSYSYFRGGCGGYMLVYQLEIADGPDPGTSQCGTPFQYGGPGANTAVKTVGVSL